LADGAERPGQAVAHPLARGGGGGWPRAGRFDPKTGRTHQLRVHAAEGLGVPILGDPIYGRGTGQGGGEGTMLHAAALRLERAPKPPVEAKAPLPAPFAALGFADAEL
jgi:tRNA pseudouridine32 synthase/23S rRNA pseudouridine746 synthase